MSEVGDRTVALDDLQSGRVVELVDLFEFFLKKTHQNDERNCITLLLVFAECK